MSNPIKEMTPYDTAAVLNYAMRVETLLVHLAQRWGCNPAWDDMVRCTLGHRPACMPEIQSNVKLNWRGEAEES